MQENDSDLYNCGSNGNRENCVFLRYFVEIKQIRMNGL